MDAAVTRRAKMELTNKSDIIRRALMAYLSPQELQRIKESVGVSAKTNDEYDLYYTRSMVNSFSVDLTVEGV